MLQQRPHTPQGVSVLRVLGIAGCALLGSCVTLSWTAPSQSAVSLYAPHSAVAPNIATRTAPAQALPDLDVEHVEEGPNVLPAAVAGAAVAAYPMAADAAPFEGLGVEGSPLNSYLKFWVPLVDGVLGGNPTLVHWLHPVNMGVVLLAMGGYGTYLGWNIRQTRLAGEAPAEALAGASHPLLMGLMTLFFALGGQGGLLFTMVEGRPLLASDHSVTGLAGLGLLAAQGVLGKIMKEDDNKRTIHAYLGSAIMALFVVHAVLGLKLALST